MPGTGLAYGTRLAWPRQLARDMQVVDACAAEPRVALGWHVGCLVVVEGCRRDLFGIGDCRRACLAQRLQLHRLKGETDMSQKIIKRGAPHFDIKLTGLHALAALAENGQGDPHRCAIKQAIADQVDGAEYIRVDAKKIAFSVADRRLVYDTPKPGTRAIAIFDKFRTVENDSLSLKLRKGRATLRGFLATHDAYASGRLKRPREQKPKGTKLFNPKLRINGFCV